MKTPPKHKRQSFECILSELAECGYLSDPCEADGGTWTAEPTNGWHSLCRRASESANGQWHPSPTGLRWQNGPYSTHCIHPEKYEEINRVCRLAEKFTGERVGMSYGSAARACLKFAFPQHSKKNRDDVLLEGGKIGYHECKPGKWAYGINFDIKGCYYQLIKRLASPRAGIGWNGDIDFVHLNREENSKWRDVLTFIETEKMLRNSLWGAMLGSLEPRWYFHDGEWERGIAYEGHSYGAAALVARSAWEVCRQAAQDTDAVYAQTDGIIVTSGIMPNYWNRLGLVYEPRAAGETYVHGQHRWRVGGKATKWFTKRAIWHEPVARAAQPERHYHFEWLA